MVMPSGVWFSGVRSLIGGILDAYGIGVVDMFLWQGRARSYSWGEKEVAGSDVDVYVQVVDRKGFTDLDWLNSLIRATGRPVQGYMTWVDGFLLDARIGVGLPGEEPFVSFGELEG